MLNRRNALALLGASAGGLAGGTIVQAAGSGRAAPAAPPDLGDRRQLARAFRKLAYSLDDAVTFWWMRGTRYGMVDSVATPLWDMHVATWFRTRDLDGDAFEVTSAGANYYTLPDSTELLEVFSNPYTGAELPVRYSPSKASRRVIGPAGEAIDTGAIPGMQITQRDHVNSGWIEGDDVVIRGDTLIHAEPLDPAAGARALHVNDWSTYIGPLAEMADPKSRNVRGAQYFNDVLTWPKWLQMGDRPGSFLSRCYGRKVFAYAQMPALWRRLFERVQPEAARDPAGLLAGA